ncbi:MAG: hypothetical protein ACLQVI_20590 [Polyangiaceae bacterium]
MVRVQLARYGEPDPTPTWLHGATLAVPAGPFADVDEGQGGITRADIVDLTLIAALDTFAVGSEVYVESDDPEDCLFDETTEEERSSRIWWRAVVLGPEEVT